MVIGLGMLGVLALYLGIDPLHGDINNLIPQMAATYLPPVLIALFFLLVVGALSSTADSDLAALSSIVMTDGSPAAERRRPSGRRIRAACCWSAAHHDHRAPRSPSFASLRLNILDLLVFVGALWGALVFPVIASFYWDRVTNKAFTVSSLAALAAFLPVRFGSFPTGGASRPPHRRLVSVWRRRGARPDGLRVLRAAGREDRRRRSHVVVTAPSRSAPARVRHPRRLTARVRREHDSLLPHVGARPRIVRLRDDEGTGRRLRQRARGPPTSTTTVRRWGKRRCGLTRSEPAPARSDCRLDPIYRGVPVNTAFLTARLRPDMADRRRRDSVRHHPRRRPRVGRRPQEGRAPA